MMQVLPAHDKSVEVKTSRCHQATINAVQGIRQEVAHTLQCIAEGSADQTEADPRADVVVLLAYRLPVER